MVSTSFKLGIIVGRSADTANKSYLRGIPKSLLLDNKHPPADVAIAWYIKSYYPQVKVDIITPEEISLKRLNQNDFVYIMYDLIDAYNEGGVELYEKRMKMYSNTKAILYPTVDVQKLIISKSAYYKLLVDYGIPVAPYIALPKEKYMNKTSSQRKNLVSNILNIIKKKEWPGIIAKPELGSYGTGIKIFKDVKDITSNAMYNFLQRSFEKEGFEAMLFQRYMEDFPHYYEIRTYWINGQYKKSVGTIIDYNTLGTGDEKLYIDVPTNEGGEINKNLIDDLRRIGEKIIRIIPKMYNQPNLLLRLDFGCCQVMDDTIKGVQPDLCKRYFLNEIELTPNLFPDYGEYDIINGLGDALVSKASKLLGIKEPKKSMEEKTFNNKKAVRGKLLSRKKS